MPSAMSATVRPRTAFGASLRAVGAEPAETTSVSLTGQTLTHSLQLMHSASLTTATSETFTLTGHALSHALQSVQVSALRRTLKIETREMAPRNAPIGQRYLQKKRS